MAKKEGKETIYDCRYFDNRLKGEARCVKTGHQTLGTSQMYAIKKSEEFGYCEVGEVLQYKVGEVLQEEVQRRWAYLNGHEIDINTDYAAEKEKFIAAAHKKLAKLETETKENNMSDVSSSEVKKATKGKPVTKVAPAAAKGADTSSKKLKASKVAPSGKKAATASKKNGKADKEPKTVKEPLGSPGSLLASLELREGSLKGNLASVLCANKGKMVPIKTVLKEVYGNQDVSNVGKLQMVIQGVAGRLNRKESPWHIERGEDTLGLKAGRKE